MKRKHLILTIALALGIPLAMVPLNAALKVNNNYGSSFDYGSVVSLRDYKASTTNPTSPKNSNNTNNSVDLNNPGNTNNSGNTGNSSNTGNSGNIGNSTNPGNNNSTSGSNNSPNSGNQAKPENQNNNTQYSNYVSLKNHKVNIKKSTPVQPSQPKQSTSGNETSSPTTSKPTSTPSTPSISLTGSTTLSAQGQAMVNSINQERAAAGLAPLQVNLSLVEVAQLKANDMKTNGYFSHNSPTYGSPFDMMRSAGISFRGAAENIAINSSVDGAMAAFMSSDGHRRNILNPAFTHVGIGVVQSSYGTYYVQIFAIL